MEKREIKSSYSVYRLDELTDETKKLIEYAQSKLKDAYAPYSHFRVGAAVLLENGLMLGGSNQENAAYPLCTCGERVVLTYAGAEYPDVEITSLAVAVKNDSKKVMTPASPCGSCRQIIAEYQSKQKAKIKIYLVAEGDEIYAIDSIHDILPLGFDASSL